MDPVGPPRPAPDPGPAEIRYKGVTFVPGGFIEAAMIYRSANENADMGSTFGNVPYDGTVNANLSGQIVASNFAPRSGAQMVFVSAQKQDMRVAATADRSGRFQVDLPAGDYRCLRYLRTTGLHRPGCIHRCRRCCFRQLRPEHRFIHYDWRCLQRQHLP